MASLAYLALDEGAREVRGTLEAADRAEAATLLRGQGLFPLELREVKAGARARAQGLQRHLPRLVTTSDQVLFLGQLALMLQSGLTLLQALETLAQTSSRRPLRDAATRLSVAVQGGSPFSAALEGERTFPPLVAHLVRTAEATGELERACTRAADYLDRRAALRYQLMSSLFYPGLVVLAASGVFWFMTTQVVPKFSAFLAGRGRTLPWTTQSLMDLSTFLTAHGRTLGYGALTLAALGALVWRSEPGRKAIDWVTIRTPGLAGLLRTAAMAHLGHTLGMLLRSGLPLLEALRVLSKTFAHRGYRRVVLDATEQVVQGSSLAESLKHRTVTPLCLQVIAVGERTGSLDQVLERLGTFYEGRLQRLLKILSGLVEPVVIVIVGSMVGFVYVSFFQALFALAR